MSPERTVSKLVHELGQHFTAHDQWVLLVRNASGELRVFTSARPRHARLLAADYLEITEAKREFAPRPPL